MRIVEAGVPRRLPQSERNRFSARSFAGWLPRYGTPPKVHTTGLRAALLQGHVSGGSAKGSSPLGCPRDCGISGRLADADMIRGMDSPSDNGLPPGGVVFAPLVAHGSQYESGERDGTAIRRKE